MRGLLALLVTVAGCGNGEPPACRTSGQACGQTTDCCNPLLCLAGACATANGQDLAGTAGHDLSMSMASGDLAMLSDHDFCRQLICPSLMACGVAGTLDQCTATCVAEPITIACARQAPNDCNSYALCHYQQFQASICGGAGGYPSGGTTCKAAVACENGCNAGNQAVTCLCGCLGMLSPAKAINILINNTCAAANCISCVPQTYNGPACLACSSTKCQAAYTQCQSN